MSRAIDTNSMDSSPKNSDNEWTTIPVKPKLLVSFPRYPAQPTLHMLLLHSYFPLRANKWIWHCYLDDEDLSPNPRGRERYMRIQKAFTKSGTFFAERGIVLHSLNISTPRIVELFFGSEEDLWKADALVEEYSRAMTGDDDYIRRKENIGKMVCHGVYFLEQLTHEFDDKWNLKEERLRELEDLNPVFDSHGKRVLYRIRCVHYMSSRASREKLLRTGATWAVTFSDFRVAECFIDWHVEFNFFMDPCTGGLKWYQENPPRFFLHPNGFRKSSGSSNDSGSVPGAIESSSVSAAATASGANKRIDETPEGLVLTKNPEQDRSTLNGRVETLTAAKTTNTEQQRPEIQEIATAPTDGVKQVVGEESEVQLATNASKKTGSPANIKATSAGQKTSEILSIATAPTDEVEWAVVVKKPEAQAPTNSFTKQATSTATVKINTAEQREPQPLQRLTKSTPTAPISTAGGETTAERCIGEMCGRKPESRPQGDEKYLSPPLPPPPPPYQKPIPAQFLGGSPPDTPNKFSPLVPSAPSTGGLKPPAEVVRCQYPIGPRRPEAKVAPPTKEPTGGNNGNQNPSLAAPASALATQTATTAVTTTTNKQPYRQQRQPNPRQYTDHKPSDNVTTATIATNGVSAFRGGVTAASVDTSQLKIEKIYPPGVNEKRKQAKLETRKRRAERKRADKKAAAARAAGGGGGGGEGGEAKVEGKGVEQGIITG